MNRMLFLSNFARNIMRFNAICCNSPEVLGQNSIENVPSQSNGKDFFGSRVASKINGLLLALMLIMNNKGSCFVVQLKNLARLVGNGLLIESLIVLIREGKDSIKNGFAHLGQVHVM